MTEKANKRHSSLGKFFDRIFRGRSNSLPSSSSSSVDAVRKGDAAKKKKNKKDNKTAAPSENDFGVVETERLTHFQKPKPPANRRRPRGVPASTSSLRVATIREEDEASDERCQPPEVEEKNMNVVIVEDKVTEVPRLFTPALPPPGLRDKLRSQKDRQFSEEEEDISSTKVQREKVDEDGQSASIETIDESETDLREKTGSSCSNNSEKSSHKSSANLSRSLSSKIDLEQIRSKSKNLRLVKSLEVGGKCVTENGKPLTRSSDPGRQ